jgi:hypothetical protein
MHEFVVDMLRKSLPERQFLSSNIEQGFAQVYEWL